MDRPSTTTAVRISDLMDPAALAEAIEQGYVKAQHHPVLPYRIYNYTNRCQFDRAWSGVTRQCRGLIVDDNDTVVARAYRKFFNYGEDETPFDLAEPAEVTDKADGSLAIGYPTPDGLAIATRGSFLSEQAHHATALLRERYPDFSPPDGMTVLWEIVYPANRIVVDYRGMDDLILLGAVDISNGYSTGPQGVPGWAGPRVETFAYKTLAAAISAPPRPGAEGLVVHFPSSGERLKLKQAEYVTLHRVLTQTTARTVWEFLAVGACGALIQQPTHWGSRLGMDPARAVEILEVGDKWMDRLLDGVPDEFHAWLRSTMDSLTEAVAGLQADLASRMRELGTPDRKSFAGAVAGSPNAGLLFQLYDGRDITPNLWKAVYPEPGRPFTDQSEDVA
jgi:RNA ligase